MQAQPQDVSFVPAGLHWVNRFAAGGSGITPTVETGWIDTNASLRRTLEIGLILFGGLSCLLVVMLAEAERARTYLVLRLLGCAPVLRRSLALVSAAAVGTWLVALGTAVGLGLVAVVLGRTPLVVEWSTLLVNALLVVALAVAGAAVVGRRRREVSVP